MEKLYCRATMEVTKTYGNKHELQQKPSVHERVTEFTITTGERVQGIDIDTAMLDEISQDQLFQMLPATASTDMDAWHRICDELVSESKVGIARGDNIAEDVIILVPRPN